MTEDEYLDLWTGIDRDAVRHRIRESMRVHKDDADRAAAIPLEARWYSALPNPDWSVYEDDDYAAELWVCWKRYSSRYVRDVKTLADGGLIQNVDRVADLGCAVGLTTTALQEALPDAYVYGTGPSERQAEIAVMRGVAIAPRAYQADLVFASEYFEHFQRPVDHLAEVLTFAEPTYLVIANSFTGRAIGHFDEYGVGARTVPGRAVGRLFNAHLRDAGYRLVETGFWNNRPALWAR